MTILEEAAKWMQKQAESFITDYLFKCHQTDHLEIEYAIIKFRGLFNDKHTDNIVNY